MSFLQAANAYPSSTRELLSALGRRFQSEEIRAELNRLENVETSRDFAGEKELLRLCGA